MDIPYGASYIAQWGYRLAGEEMPEPMRSILDRSIDGCHFEYPGSAHSIRVRGENEKHPLEAYVYNSDEHARTCSRSLKVSVPGRRATDTVYLYKQTHYAPEDFHDSRYDPCFSPLIYPGQRIHASAMLSENSCGAQVCLYVRDAHSGKIYTSRGEKVVSGQWLDLTFDIPAMEGALIDEAGVCLRVLGEHGGGQATLTVFADDLYFDGQPDYSVELDRERMSRKTAANGGRCRKPMEIGIRSMFA